MPIGLLRRTSTTPSPPAVTDTDGLTKGGNSSQSNLGHESAGIGILDAAGAKQLSSIGATGTFNNGVSHLSGEMPCSDVCRGGLDSTNCSMGGSSSLGGAASHGGGISHCGTWSQGGSASHGGSCSTGGFSHRGDYSIGGSCVDLDPYPTAEHQPLQTSHSAPVGAAVASAEILPVKTSLGQRSCDLVAAGTWQVNDNAVAPGPLPLDPPAGSSPPRRPLASNSIRAASSYVANQRYTPPLQTLAYPRQTSGSSFTQGTAASAATATTNTALHPKDDFSAPVVSTRSRPLYGFQPQPVIQPPQSRVVAVVAQLDGTALASGAAAVRDPAAAAAADVVHGAASRRPSLSSHGGGTASLQHSPSLLPGSSFNSRIPKAPPPAQRAADGSGRNVARSGSAPSPCWTAADPTIAPECSATSASAASVGLPGLPSGRRGGAPSSSSLPSGAWQRTVGDGPAAAAGADATTSASLFATAAKPVTLVSTTSRPYTRSVGTSYGPSNQPQPRRTSMPQAPSSCSSAAADVASSASALPAAPQARPPFNPYCKSTPKTASTAGLALAAAGASSRRPASLAAGTAGACVSARSSMRHPHAAGAPTQARPVSSSDSLALAAGPGPVSLRSGSRAAPSGRNTVQRSVDASPLTAHAADPRVTRHFTRVASGTRPGPALPVTRGGPLPPAPAKTSLNVPCTDAQPTTSARQQQRSTVASISSAGSPRDDRGLGCKNAAMLPPPDTSRAEIAAAAITAAACNVPVRPPPRRMSRHRYSVESACSDHATTGLSGPSPRYLPASPPRHAQHGSPASPSSITPNSLADTLPLLRSPGCPTPSLFSPDPPSARPPPPDHEDLAMPMASPDPCAFVPGGTRGRRTAARRARSRADWPCRGRDSASQHAIQSSDDEREDGADEAEAGAGDDGRDPAGGLAEAGGQGVRAWHSVEDDDGDDSDTGFGLPAWAWRSVAVLLSTDAAASQDRSRQQQLQPRGDGGRTRGQALPRQLALSDALEDRSLLPLRSLSGTPHRRPSPAGVAPAAVAVTAGSASGGPLPEPVSTRDEDEGVLSPVLPAAGSGAGPVARALSGPLPASEEGCTPLLFRRHTVRDRYTSCLTPRGDGAEGRDDSSGYAASTGDSVHSSDTEEPSAPLPARGEQPDGQPGSVSAGVPLAPMTPLSAPDMDAMVLESLRLSASTFAGLWPLPLAPAPAVPAGGDAALTARTEDSVLAGTVVAASSSEGQDPRLLTAAGAESEASVDAPLATDPRSSSGSVAGTAHSESAVVPDDNTSAADAASVAAASASVDGTSCRLPYLGFANQPGLAGAATSEDGCNSAANSSVIAQCALLVSPDDSLQDSVEQLVGHTALACSTDPDPDALSQPKAAARQQHSAFAESTGSWPPEAAGCETPSSPPRTLQRRCSQGASGAPRRRPSLERLDGKLAAALQALRASMATTESFEPARPLGGPRRLSCADGTAVSATAEDASLAAAPSGPLCAPRPPLVQLEESRSSSGTEAAHDGTVIVQIAAPVVPKGLSKQGSAAAEDLALGLLSNSERGDAVLPVDQEQVASQPDSSAGRKVMELSAVVTVLGAATAGALGGAGALSLTTSSGGLAALGSAAAAAANAVVAAAAATACSLAWGPSACESAAGSGATPSAVTLSLVAVAGIAAVSALAAGRILSRLSAAGRDRNSDQAQRDLGMAAAYNAQLAAPVCLPLLRDQQEQRALDATQQQLEGCHAADSWRHPQSDDTASQSDRLERGCDTAPVVPPAATEPDAPEASRPPSSLQDDTSAAEAAVVGTLAAAASDTGRDASEALGEEADQRRTRVRAIAASAAEACAEALAVMRASGCDPAALRRLARAYGVIAGMQLAAEGGAGAPLPANATDWSELHSLVRERLRRTGAGALPLQPRPALCDSGEHGAACSLAAGGFAAEEDGVAAEAASESASSQKEEQQRRQLAEVAAAAGEAAREHLDGEAAQREALERAVEVRAALRCVAASAARDSAIRAAADAAGAAACCALLDRRREAALAAATEQAAFDAAAAVRGSAGAEQAVLKLVRSRTVLVSVCMAVEAAEAAASHRATQAEDAGLLALYEDRARCRAAYAHASAFSAAVATRAGAAECLAFAALADRQRADLAAAAASAAEDAAAAARCSGLEEAAQLQLEGARVAAVASVSAAEAAAAAESLQAGSAAADAVEALVAWAQLLLARVSQGLAAESALTVRAAGCEAGAGATLAANRQQQLVTVAEAAAACANQAGQADAAASRAVAAMWAHRQAVLALVSFVSGQTAYLEVHGGAAAGRAVADWLRTRRRPLRAAACVARHASVRAVAAEAAEEQACLALLLHRRVAGLSAVAAQAAADAAAALWGAWGEGLALELMARRRRVLPGVCLAVEAAEAMEADSALLGEQEALLALSCVRTSHKVACALDTAGSAADAVRASVAESAAVEGLVKRRQEQLATLAVAVADAVALAVAAVEGEAAAQQELACARAGLLQACFAVEAALAEEAVRAADCSLAAVHELVASRQQRMHDIACTAAADAAAAVLAQCAEACALGAQWRRQVRSWPLHCDADEELSVAAGAEKRQSPVFQSVQGLWGRREGAGAWGEGERLGAGGTGSLRQSVGSGWWRFLGLAGQRKTGVKVRSFRVSRAQLASNV